MLLLGEHRMIDNIYEKSDLMRFINEPLPMQYQRIMAKIMQAIMWTEGDIAIAFSGGKDSALMLDMYCDIVSTLYSTLKDKPIKVMWANTTNETKAMREYVPFFIKRCEAKYGVKIDFVEVTPKKGQNIVSVMNHKDTTPLSGSKRVRSLRFLPCRFRKEMRFQV